MKLKAAVAALTIVDLHNQSKCNESLMNRITQIGASLCQTIFLKMMILES